MVATVSSVSVKRNRLTPYRPSAIKPTSHHSDVNSVSSPVRHTNFQMSRQRASR